MVFPGCPTESARSAIQAWQVVEQGLGVPQSTSEAIKWYQQAIAKGDSEAEESLRALEK